VTEEEAKAAADKAEQDRQASEAGAALARRKADAEAEARTAREAPCKMVDLHDVRAEAMGAVESLRSELTGMKNVRHAVPETTHAPAQKSGGGRGFLGGILGAVLVFGLLILVAGMKARHER
jgi:hypothetical protein